MKICILSSAPFPPKEGIGNYIFNMSKRFVEMGEEVTLITRGGLNSTERSQLEDIDGVIDGVQILKAPFLPFYPFHVHIHGLFVNNIFKHLDPDIVNIHSPLSPLINTNLPIISTFHTPMKTDIASFESTGLFSYESKAQVTFSIMVENKLLDRSDLITVVSNSVFNELVNEYNIEPSRIRVVYNGVDEKTFCPLQNRSCNKKYILYVGRLTYRKGLFDLIEAAREIIKIFPDICFVIVGNGHLADKLKIMVKGFGLEKNFLIKGFIPKEELIRLYQNATVYVLPSHYEGLPTVLLEAMACGLPVVATAVSGNLDVIKNGDNGILINPKAPKEMASAISILLNDDEMRKKLGSNARKTIEERYTWKTVSDRVLKCYESLI